MAGIWPFTRQKESIKTDSLNDYIKSLLDEKQKLQDKVSELEAKLSSMIKTEVLVSMVVESIKHYINKQPRTTYSKDNREAELEKENKQLKAQVKRLKNSNKTLTAGIDQDSQFKQIDDIRDRISQFLKDEDSMFISEVREPLEDNDYYDEMLPLDNIKDDVINDIAKIITSGKEEDILQGLNNTIKRMVNNSKYSKFVRRSIGMNNKTKDIMQDLIDSLSVLDESITDEIVKLKLENKELKNKILLVVDTDSEKTISQLQQEIAGLKIENEALRYKGGKNI